MNCILFTKISVKFDSFRKQALRFAYIFRRKCITWILTFIVCNSVRRHVIKFPSEREITQRDVTRVFLIFF